MSEKNAEDPLVYTGWLAVNCAYPESKFKARLSARLTKTKPALKRDEIAVRLEFSLPRAMFVKPALKALIHVDNSEVTPPEISILVKDEVEQVLRDRLGVNVRILTTGDES